MNTEPKISTEQAKAIVDTKTAPRVTEERIKSRIADVTYYRFDTLTICIITMQNGFKSIGKSAPVSKANFDAAVGERYAYEDAFNPLWALEGYLLLEESRSPAITSIAPKKQRKPRAPRTVKAVVAAKAEAVKADATADAAPSSNDPAPFPWVQRPAPAQAAAS